MPRPFYPPISIESQKRLGTFWRRERFLKWLSYPVTHDMPQCEAPAYFCADGLLYWFVYGLMCLIQSLITLLCLRGTHSCWPRRSLHCRTSFKVEGRSVSHCFQIATNSLSKCLSKFSKIPCYAVWVWNSVSHIKGTRYAEGVGVKGGEGDVWAEERGSDRGLETIS